MAIFRSTIFTDIKKSIGNVTFTKLKGQLIAKQKIYQTANPRTALQTEQREKLSLMVRSWKSSSALGNFAIKEYDRVRTPYSQYISMNIDNATTYGALGAAIDYTKLAISKGSLEVPAGLTATIATNIVTFTYVAAGHFNANNANDIIYVAIIEPAKEFVSYKEIGLRGVDGNTTITVTGGASPDVVYGFGFALSEDMRKGSDTNVLGELTIAS